MTNFPWRKSLFAILGISVAMALIAKFVTANALVLIPLSVGLYWLLMSRGESTSGK